MDERVRSAARRTEQHTPFRALARGGYVASGVVHAIIGALALTLVVQDGRAEADQVGALASIARVPLGFAALWALALLLFALGGFHLVHGFALRRPARSERWRRRLAEWGQGAAFCVMGGASIAVALGARPDPDRTARDASRGLLALPGGTVLLVLVGLAVIGVGAGWVGMGIARSFRARIDLPPGWRGRAVSALGVVGFTGKGAALVIVGGLLAVAGWQRSAASAGALDGAISALHGLPGGPIIIVLISLGFFAYGAFCMFRARLAKL